MKKKSTLDKISESQKATLYSISFEKDGTTEFEKFVSEFEMNAQYNYDYQRIIAALQIILNRGTLERFFRPEGKINDNVHAIPIEGEQTKIVLSSHFRTNHHSWKWRGEKHKEVPG